MRNLRIGLTGCVLCVVAFLVGHDATAWALEPNPRNCSSNSTAVKDGGLWQLNCSTYSAWCAPNDCNASAYTDPEENQWDFCSCLSPPVPPWCTVLVSADQTQAECFNGGCSAGQCDVWGQGVTERNCQCL